MSDLIKKFEGLRLSPYLDSANISTIGYGTIKYPPKSWFDRNKIKTTLPFGKKVTMRDPTITKEQAEYCHRYDVERFEDALQTLVKVPLTQNQHEALLSLMYNIGIGAFSKSTLLRKLNSVPGEFLKWKYAGGKMSPGLLKRRNQEKNLFLTPDKKQNTIKCESKSFWDVLSSLFNKKGE